MSRFLLVAIASITFLSACNGSKEAAKPALPAIPARPVSAPGSLVVVGTLQEIPGAFPANDIYNYAYVMKYKVDTVIEGTFSGSEILVGHYNPRFPRNAIQDDQKGLVGGNVVGFQTGDRHYLVLRPLDSAWTGAIEDGFTQETSPRWWASWSDRI